nr:MAG TPA: hypothetical protein [Caudoviricetes sp.]
MHVGTDRRPPRGLRRSGAREPSWSQVRGRVRWSE